VLYIIWNDTRCQKDRFWDRAKKHQPQASKRSGYRHCAAEASLQPVQAQTLPTREHTELTLPEDLNRATFLLDILRC
jgi:hypothetical protein